MSEDEIIMQKEEAYNIVGDLGNLGVQKLADSLENLQVIDTRCRCNLDSESIKRLSFIAIMRGFTCEYQK